VEDELVERVRPDEAQPDGALHQRGAQQREQDVSDNHDAGYNGRLDACSTSYSWKVETGPHIMLALTRFM